MKQVIVCLSCNKTTPVGLCYQAEREEHVKNMLTGQIVEQKVKGHICADCNSKMGYKTHKKKLEKLLKARGE